MYIFQSVIFQFSGIPKALRKNVSNGVFGQGGVIDAEDSITYETRLQDVSSF